MYSLPGRGYFCRLCTTVNNICRPEQGTRELIAKAKIPAVRCTVSFPYLIAQNLAARRICLGNSIPSILT